MNYESKIHINHQFSYQSFHKTPAKTSQVAFSRLISFLSHHRDSHSIRTRTIRQRLPNSQCKLLLWTHSSPPVVGLVEVVDKITHVLTSATTHPFKNRELESTTDARRTTTTTSPHQRSRMRSGARPTRCDEHHRAWRPLTANRQLPVASVSLSMIAENLMR